MTGTMRAAHRDRQLALIRAHPDLAGNAAIRGELTSASRTEQSGAGLDRCTPGEFARLRALNDAYKAKHGFPFVMAVRNKSRADILAALAGRLDNPTDAEFERALAEIAEIARLRLADLVTD
jgi:OHCU decarboxylase